MAKRGRPAKDKYADLDPNFRTIVDGGDETEIRAKLAEVALHAAHMAVLEKDDSDLAEKKEAAKQAGEIYSEAKKQSRLQFAYAREMLRLQGRKVD